jgi:homoserine kinase
LNTTDVESFSVMKSCIAIAPSSTANLGPGFDVFGLALDPLADRVRIVRGPRKSGNIVIRMSGKKGRAIPCGPDSNTAGLVVRKMARDFELEDDLSLYIDKGVPTGLGLGSSAASAAAAAVALNGLFDLKIGKRELIRYAAEGEIASAGTRHYDNVSASVLGGFVIVRTTPELDFIRIDPPGDLILVIAAPLMDLPTRKTEFARSLLPKRIPLKGLVHNVSNATTVVAGFLLKEVDLLSKGIDDAVIEPARGRLIPGYEEVKRKALEAGALAVTISGAGPSMISFLKTDRDGKRVARAMASGFKEAGLRCRTYVCRPSRGARLLQTP